MWYIRIASNGMERTQQIHHRTMLAPQGRDVGECSMVSVRSMKKIDPIGWHKIREQDNLETEPLSRQFKSFSQSGSIGVIKILCNCIRISQPNQILHNLILDGVWQIHQLTWTAVSHCYTAGLTTNWTMGRTHETHHPWHTPCTKQSHESMI